MKRPSIQACQQNLFEIEPVKPQPKEKSDDSFILDIVDALQAPILTFSPAWADTIPERMLRIVPLARMKGLMMRETSATYVECAIYIYTRSLDAPMDSEWVDIYTHVCCTVTEEYFGEDHWDYVKAPKELSNWCRSKLDDLRRHIYDKRRQIVKQRIRAEEPDRTKSATPEPKRQHAEQQPTLFT
jgi:hypothetical protein